MPQADGGLAQLLAEGFIEAAATAATAAPAPRAAADFSAMQRMAVRQLTDLVGPLGEALAMRIEKARSLDELRPLLATAEQVIANTRGRQAAADFAARLRDL